MILITAEVLEKKTTINGLQIDGGLKKVSEFFEAITKAIDTLKYYENKKAEPVVHGEWINTEDRMPEEHDSIFANLYGTDEWNDAMFRKTSDDVNVVWEYDNGTRVVKIMCTEDGEFREPSYKMQKVNRHIGCHYQSHQNEKLLTPTDMQINVGWKVQLKRGGKSL